MNKQSIFLASKSEHSIMQQDKKDELVSSTTFVSTEINTPIIFKKKNKKSAIKPMVFLNSDTGVVRHYPPAAQEWFNSVYTYNKLYPKLLPVADSNLMKLLKGYFNLFLGHKFMNTKRIANRYKRTCAKKVFVGKGDLKHTNDKVVITFYVYNTEKLYLKNITNKLLRSTYYPEQELNIKGINWDQNGKKVITYNRPYTLEEFSQLSDIYNLYHTIFTQKAFLNLKKIFNAVETSYIQSGILPDFNMLNAKYLECIAKLSWLENNKPYIDTTYTNIKAKFMMGVVNYYLKNLKQYIYLLMVHKAKFQKPFILTLNCLARNLYNKEVEFNIVNLKKMHLNSDIFTQAVALKLRNRDNKLFRVLRSSLNKVKLANVSRVTERFSKINRNEILINKIRNSYINSMFNNETLGVRPSTAITTTNTNTALTASKRDPLNSLLLQIFPSSFAFISLPSKAKASHSHSHSHSIEVKGAVGVSESNSNKKEVTESTNIQIEIDKRSSTIKRSISLKSFIFRSLKHLNLAGVRVEAKGRLTRRFTASKSVFKLKWKGGLKNVDSSFKGLSAVMLRGDFKSNLQYSMLSSKTRNGAFGVKGWVSSK